MGITNVHVEPDSMLLKLALDNNTIELATTRGIVFETKSLINMYFASCSVSYCPRVCNRVASLWRRKVVSVLVILSRCKDGVPTCVEDLVTSGITASLS
jgi:hypothetical protein